MGKCEKEKEDLLWVSYAMKNGLENLIAIAINRFNMGDPVHAYLLHSSLGGYLLMYKAQKHYSFFEKL